MNDVYLMFALVTQARSMPFDPPAFSPAKLTIAYEDGSEAVAALPIELRRYTLTHNDLTGALLLTIGPQFSAPQLSGARHKHTMRVLSMLVPCNNEHGR